TQLKTLLALVLLSTLTACGGGGSSSSSSDSSAPTPTNTVPTANAGVDQNVQTGVLVTLNGGDSTDADGDQITFLWTITDQPDGASAALSDTESAMPRFTPDLDGQYRILLSVSDGSLSATDEVVVTSATANSAPVANAGVDQNVATGSTVILDGTQSTDSDGDPINYTWSITTKPQGSAATLSATSVANPSFTPDLDGEYIVSLVVNDGTVNSLEDTVKITSAFVNSAPIAKVSASALSVITGDVAFLDGNLSSDADGDQLTYKWSFVSKPTGSNAALNNDSIGSPNFTTDVAGVYIASLTVNDGLEDSEPSNISIEAVEPEIKLYNDTSYFGSPVYSEVSMPYSTSGVYSASVSGIPRPTTYTIESFKLQSIGGNFTIINLSAVDNNAIVVPYFDGLSDGAVITDGNEIEFELVSPLTGNQTTDLIFQFEIAETGETFNARYQLRTN
ncbi:MAG: hypothetical protein IE928_10575, partial [Gammaproteobacteria bacterium]|nr:hypothetical protein [Gammaproteobacteria bacterium]